MRMKTFDYIRQTRHVLVAAILLWSSFTCIAQEIQVVYLDTIPDSSLWRGPDTLPPLPQEWQYEKSPHVLKPLSDSCSIDEIRTALIKKVLKRRVLLARQTRKENYYWFQTHFDSLNKLPGVSKHLNVIGSLAGEIKLEDDNCHIELYMFTVWALRRKKDWNSKALTNIQLAVQSYLVQFLNSIE